MESKARYEDIGQIEQRLETDIPEMQNKIRMIRTEREDGDTNTTQ